MTDATVLAASSLETPAAMHLDPFIAGAEGPIPPRPWSTLHRVLFRVAFVYFLLFAFCFGNGSLFQFYGPVGDWIETALDWMPFHLVEFISTRLLHNTGIGATFHPTGSGDTLVQWVQQWVYIAVAVIAGLIWSALATARGHRRVEYTAAHAWLRFLLRLTCGMFMMAYGLDKLFPLQMAPLSSAILTEPVGNLSPMTMLWSLLALNPAYQMICGGIEIMGGVLILFRRTALAGTLLSVFVMSNVLLYNLFFDVPVKIFAANLLLALLFIALPDVPAVFSFFWLHQPSAPTGVWIPPTSRRWFRITTRAIELVFALTFLVVAPIQVAMTWHSHKQAQAHPLPIRGAWHIDTPSAGFADPEKHLITELFLDSPTLVRSRSADGQLWRTSLKIDDKAHAYGLSVYTTGSRATFTSSMPDHDHLVLTAVPDKDAKGQPQKNFQPFTLAMTRIPLPNSYPLQERGLHWVNEWGLER